MYQILIKNWMLISLLDFFIESIFIVNKENLTKPPEKNKTEKSEVAKQFLDINLFSFLSSKLF